MVGILNIILIAQKHLQDVYFRFIVMLYRSEPCRSRISIFEKNSIFPFEKQKANSFTFCTKLAQIVGYGQIVIGIVQRGPRRCFSIPIIITERVQMKKSKSMKKISKKKMFLTNFLENHFKALLEKLNFEMSKIQKFSL